MCSCGNCSLWLYCLIYCSFGLVYCGLRLCELCCWYLLCWFVACLLACCLGVVMVVLISLWGLFACCCLVAGCMDFLVLLCGFGLGCFMC